MVDQDGVTLAEVTCDDREEFAEEVVTARVMEIGIGHEFPRHRLAEVHRDAHARAGRDQARNDDGAGRCREPEQARGHVERQAVPLHANMPVVPAFRCDHQDLSRPQMFVHRAELGPIEDAASIRASRHGAEPVDITPVEWAPPRGCPEAPPPASPPRAASALAGPSARNAGWPE